MNLATKWARVSWRTVWLRRRTDPAFAAALREAERHGLAIRAERRDRHFRRRFLALALQADDKKFLNDGRLSRKMKKLWHRWHGYWPEPKLPPEGHPLADLVRAQAEQRKQAAFAERRAQKRGGKPVAPIPLPRPTRGSAGVLF